MHNKLNAKKTQHGIKSQPSYFLLVLKILKRILGLAKDTFILGIKDALLFKPYIQRNFSHQHSSYSHESHLRNSCTTLAQRFAWI